MNADIAIRWLRQRAFGVSQGQGIGGKEDRRTRRRRLTSGCAEVKSRMFPLIIHSEMIHNGNSLGQIPKTGSTLGWDRRRQIAMSWNKRCHELSAVRVKHKIIVRKPSLFQPSCRQCTRGTPLCTQDSRYSYLSRRLQIHQKRMRCLLPLKYCLIEYKNVGELSGGHKLSEGCEHCFSGYQGTYSAPPKPVQG